jgi:hypothetical protein
LNPIGTAKFTDFSYAWTPKVRDLSGGKGWLRITPVGGNFPVVWGPFSVV